MARIRAVTRTHRRMLMKTGTYYVTHMGVAATVAYLVTGSFWVAVTLSMLEPTVQAVAYFLHERAWDRHENTASNLLEAKPASA